MKTLLLTYLILLSSTGFTQSEMNLEGISEICGTEVSYNVENITPAQIKADQGEIFKSLEMKLAQLNGASNASEVYLERRYQQEPENEFREVLVVYEKACVLVLE